MQQSVENFTYDKTNYGSLQSYDEYFDILVEEYAQRQISIIYGSGLRMAASDFLLHLKELIEGLKELYVSRLWQRLMFFTREYR